MSNTELWDRLGRTDPSHTKPFKRAGGFTGTAIKPMWSYKRLTEEFGPCGTGWGVEEPSFNVVPGDNKEVLVFCTVRCWYTKGTEKHFITGVGGDKIVTYIKGNEQYKKPERWENDDEAFKKAFTDAVTNAFKLIGVGADVHMGMFEDSKYITSLKERFSDDAANEEQAKSSAQLKREGAWEKVTGEIANAMVDIHTFGQFEQLKADVRERARTEKWNAPFLSALKDFLAGCEKDLEEKIEKENQEAA